MKFGQEFQKALESADFPEHWRESAIEYKHLKKCIKKIHRELESIGLDAETLSRLSEFMDSGQATAASEAPEPQPHESRGYYSAASPTLSAVPEEFSPQLRVLVDGKTGTPLDATLTPETRESLQKLARHEMAANGRREVLGVPRPIHQLNRQSSDEMSIDTPPRKLSTLTVSTDDTSRHPSMSVEDARWIQVPLASAKDFFDMLEPKLHELEVLRAAETEKLEEQILDLGDAVEDVVEPVLEGFEATRSVSYRDLYFWREMFRLYLEQPIFYSETGARQGALTFREAKARLEDFDRQIRSTGLLAKMKTPQAKAAAQRFLDLNVDILKIMHFQEMNARAMTKILKKFDKQTHIEGQTFLKTLRSQYPALLPVNGKNGIKTDPRNSPGGFADSIARDLTAELASKVLSIVPQLQDWNCPVCLSLAWPPVNLGCCRSVFCIKCIMRLQAEGIERCPVCNSDTVLNADGRKIDFETMDFLEKYFPLEAKKRQKTNGIRDGRTFDHIAV